MPVPVEFHPNKHLDFIHRHGQRILYSRSYKCSCFDEDSQNRKIDCPYCDVDGYRYECPMPTTVIITGIQDVQNFNQIGLLKQGDCYGGFPWTIPVAFHDKVILMNKLVREEALLIEGDIDAGLLKNYEVCRIDNAHTLTKKFTAYKDFKLSADGLRVEWNDPLNKPENGEHFTVQIWIRPIYLVWDTLPLERLSENKSMPKRVVLRRKDDFGGLGRRGVGGV